MRWSLLLALSALPVLAIADTPSPWPRTDPEVEWLVASLEGRFTSAPGTRGGDIVVDVRPIWTNRSDGRWLYREESLAGELQPARQRIHRVHRLRDGTFVIETYLLPDPSKFVGEGARAQPFVSLSPKDLIRREGCDVLLHHRDDGAFAGGTVGETCESEAPGARVSTIGLVVWPDQVEGSTHEWDVKHVQIAGRDVVFVRQE